MPPPAVLAALIAATSAACVQGTLLPQSAADHDRLRHHQRKQPHVDTKQASPLSPVSWLPSVASTANIDHKPTRRTNQPGLTAAASFCPLM